jgi:hypothetical protein
VAKTICLIILVLWFGPALDSAVNAAPGPGSCKGAPKYHVAMGGRASSVDNPLTLYLQISVASDAISKESLLRLACKLANDFAKEQRLHVWIFTDSVAAKRFDFDQTSPTYRQDLAKLRGAYWLDRDKSQQWVRFSIDPDKPGDMRQIDLPAPASK